MPLVIDYQYATTTFDAPERQGIFHALQIRGRVRRVVLHMPTSSLDDLLVLMDEPFPVLEQLTISSTTEGTNMILPETFLAPNLRHLTLSGITLPGELTLLSTVSLVTLTLTNLRATSYFLPKHLATHLRSFSQLEELSVSFSIPLPRPSSESELSDVLESPVTLPTLRRLIFKGVTAYLDSLVAQIRAPLLEQLSITLFNQIAFALPQLSDFTNATPGLKLPVANVTFKHDGVSVVTEHRTQQMGDRQSGFSLRVICKQFDWQIDASAQICRSLMPVLSCVEDLTLDIDGQEMPTEWQNSAVDGAAWHELLRPFVGVDRLLVCRALAQELSCALKSDDVGLDLGLLPVLQVLVHRLDVERGYNAFGSFVDARRIAGRRVRLLTREHVLDDDASFKSFLYPLRNLLVFSHFSSSLSQEEDSWNRTKDLNISCTLLVQVENDLPPPRTARSVRGSVKVQPSPPKHIRCRTRPSHKGAGSAWR
jgi:hypothetical protein